MFPKPVTTATRTISTWTQFGSASKSFCRTATRSLLASSNQSSRSVSSTRVRDRRVLLMLIYPNFALIYMSSHLPPTNHPWKFYVLYCMSFCMCVCVVCMYFCRCVCFMYCMYVFLYMILCICLYEFLYICMLLCLWNFSSLLTFY